MGPQAPLLPRTGVGSPKDVAASVDKKNRRGRLSKMVSEWLSKHGGVEGTNSYGPEVDAGQASQQGW